MKKITLSFTMLAVIALVIIAATAGVTGAFFSDTESSAGNTFTAGAIDLTVDNESYVSATTTDALAFSPATSWSLRDLTGELFFAFQDLKPGDVGEDTISLHVKNNDSYGCMNITLTSTPENGQTEPEILVDGTAGANQGELQDELHFAFWADDGDNVFESGETIFKQGSAASLFAAGGDDWIIADSSGNIFGASAGTPIPGEEVRYIAKYWCFGAFSTSTAAVAQDGIGRTGTGAGDSTNGPLVRGTGFSCSLAGVGNKSQTDGITVDVEFRAEQSRNNAAFLCNPGE